MTPNRSEIIGFGQRLKIARKVNEITQLQLGNAIGVSLNTISRYEKDLFLPSFDKLISLCNTLNVTSDFLLGI